MPEITLNKPSPTPATPPATMAQTYAVQRTNMVDSQVRPSDITDRRIIRGMGLVPREEFVPAVSRATAYMDNPIVLERAPALRALMEPRLFAKLVQLTEIPDGGRVLEIGCGTGYGVAVLSAMGCKAIGLEETASLADVGEVVLKKVGGDAKIKRGSLATGLAVDGPFDAIIFGGSLPTIPQAIFDQLKNGAKLVAVTGGGPGSKAVVWLRSGTTYASREAFDATAAPLPGFTRPEQFVF